MQEATYGEGQRHLDNGDLLALYTDGIIEAPNAHGEEFGEARLLEVLTSYRRRDLNEIILSVFEQLSQWTGGGPPHDDATIVLVRAR
jgi:sigma-B regulation protein RsbU (phosphoserine phosphatase)